MEIEMSKNMQGPNKQGVTSQIHEESGSGGGVEEEMASLAQQSSIYSLMMGELQNADCEPSNNFVPMNIDELLANIWNGEEVQPTVGSKVAVEDPMPMVSTTVRGARGNLNRQGSLLKPTTPCCKKAEETWAKVYEGPVQAPNLSQAQQQMVNGNNNIYQQQDLSEMTLEDFLVEAGVLREGYNGMTNQATVVAITAATSMAPMPQGQFSGMMYLARANDTYSRMSLRSSDGLGTVTAGDMTSSVANGTMVGNGGRKRVASEAMSVENMAEQCQRRMIKNRESAARSRARKQAYLMELKAKVNEQKEEIMRLKAKEKTFQLVQKKMLVDKMMEHSKENANTKKGGNSLRRCSSCFL